MSKKELSAIYKQVLKISEEKWGGPEKEENKKYYQILEECFQEALREIEND